MDDLRFRWLKDSIYTILNIDENDPAFEEFLEGEDGANELLIGNFLMKLVPMLMKKMLYYFIRKFSKNYVKNKLK